jgi:radical SAM protein with 4Fe4S-binding SPASM domain
LPDQLIKELKDDRIDRLIFSIHGLRDNHDYITGTPGSFDLVLTSIKKAVAAGIHVELHFVPMKVNEQDVPQIIELANGIGVYHISFLRLVPQGRCAQNRDLLLDKPSLEKVVAWKYIYEKKLPHMKIRLGAPFNCIHPTVPCSAGENKLLISPNGEVFPCEAFKFLRGRQNTIYKSTLEDLWAKDDLLNQLRTLKHDEGIKDCYDCFRKDTCRGGCPGQHLLHYGHLKYGPDPLCNIEPGGQEDVCFCRQEY